MTETENRGFYEYSPDELNFVPFDIETTGFKASSGDFITVFILHNNDQYHIWLNVGEDKNVDVQKMYDKIEAKSGFSNFVLYIVNTEKMLLENVDDYLSSYTNHNTILTAFNGETYKGDSDFDVPFLRTRSLRNGVSWLLEGFWYTDSYEVFSKKNRFDTTIRPKPSLEGMKKNDLIQFVNDRGFDIHYDKMKKAEVVREIKNHPGVNEIVLSNWAEENNISDVDPSDPSTFTKSELERFIDNQSLNISYNKLSKDGLIQRIREEGFTSDMLMEWHEETDLSLGKDTIDDLDGIHKLMLEDKLDSSEWRNRLPFDVEVFEPFDPFDSSGEAVSQYNKGNYTNVILHCFADVARTVNLTRMMAEYAPMKDYKPKVL